jgi:hypothetical protein
MWCYTGQQKFCCASYPEAMSCESRVAQLRPHLVAPMQENWFCEGPGPLHCDVFKEQIASVQVIDVEMVFESMNRVRGPFLMQQHDSFSTGEVRLGRRQRYLITCICI